MDICLAETNMLSQNIRNAKYKVIIMKYALYCSIIQKLYSMIAKSKSGKIDQQQNQHREAAKSFDKFACPYFTS